MLPRPPQGKGKTVPAGAPQPSIQPPAPSSGPRKFDEDTFACIFREMLVQGTSPENQRRFGVDPNTGRATDTEDPAPHVPAPPMFPTNVNQQGLHGFTISMGRGPAWEQQLRDMLGAQY